MRKLLSGVKRRPLTWVGIGFTIAYMTLFFLTPIFGINSVVSLTLNEMGDFLAGTFAPLALFWLVIGYFQHGQELRLNTEALRAQQEELRRQVEETAILAKSAERQAQASEDSVAFNRTERQRENARRVAAAQPMFVAAGGGSGREFSQGISNQGADITAVEIHFPSHQQLANKIFRYNIWKKDESRNLGFGSGLSPDDFPITIVIDYTDKLTNRNTMWFNVFSNHELKPVEQEAESSAPDDILSDPKG